MQRSSVRLDLSNEPNPLGLIDQVWMGNAEPANPGEEDVCFVSGADRTGKRFRKGPLDPESYSPTTEDLQDSQAKTQRVGKLPCDSLLTKEGGDSPIDSHTCARTQAHTQHTHNHLLSYPYSIFYFIFT